MARYSDVPEDETKEAQKKKPRAREAADLALEEVDRGVRRAARAFAEPHGSEVEGLIGRTDLPALAGDDPLLELAERLDREADLWRNLAFRELARTAWSSRLLVALAIVVLVADAALGGIAALGALFGAEAGARSVLVLTAAGVVTAALGVVWLVVHGNRRTQAEVVKGALARADVAELRLHRLGVALAWRKADAAKYAEALARLEREAAG